MIVVQNAALRLRLFVSGGVMLAGWILFAVGVNFCHVGDVSGTAAGDLGVERVAQPGAEDRAVWR